MGRSVLGLLGGLVYALGFGLSIELIFGSDEELQQRLLTGLLIGLQYWLLSGLLLGLVYGGYACLSHLALRVILWGRGYLPWNIAHFLDYCTERIFLRKVGGGYIFIHRTLLEYFATLEPPHAPPSAHEPMLENHPTPSQYPT